ncbi:hypothetical protein D9758_016812 [Tetrapyrgos nigripes]|uniref:N-acetyltransferase domain-containing protein n=1 Tax=Tetrapyrgos nigripes TaxID=182062 RepID=A0A8H5CGJ7_9AGAR|nr:hypothetical protein D9758_016812 [Tetrapyrgos nigripes]
MEVSIIQSNTDLKGKLIPYMATDEQLRHLAAVSVRAFSGDFTHEVIFGGDWDLAHEYFTAIIRAGLAGGELYGVNVLDEESGECKIITFWYLVSPRYSPVPKHWNNHILPELGKQRDDLFTPEELKIRWAYVHLVTDPDYQGRGFAKALVNEVYARAKANKQLIALMTEEDNVKKYMRMGFQERGQCSVSTPESISRDLVMHIMSRE